MGGCTHSLLTGGSLFFRREIRLVTGPKSSIPPFAGRSIFAMLNLALEDTNYHLQAGFCTQCCSIMTIYSSNLDASVEIFLCPLTFRLTVAQ